MRRLEEKTKCLGTFFHLLHIINIVKLAKDNRSADFYVRVRSLMTRHASRT